MEQKFIDLWFKNKDKLEEALMNYEDLEWCSYLDLFKLTIKNIINAGRTDYDRILDEDKITEINNGDFRGTLLFIIPGSIYNPMEDEYYITFVNYGNCFGYDTLLAIQHNYGYESKKEQVNDLMMLCLHMLERMKRPFGEE